MQEYIDAFELAQTHVSLLPEHALSIFLSGLEHNTQMQVRMFNPTDIAHAANLARLYESSKAPVIRTNPSIHSEHPIHDIPQLSMNALTSIPTHQTMRVTGMYNNKPIQILIDSGSTHNFLDVDAAQRLGCVLDSVTPLSVTAGGGNKIQAPYTCRNFTWQLKQCTFSEDVIVLPIVCCDLIIGVQW